MPNGRFAFVGLNALNACEKGLFDYLKSREKAMFYWDYAPLHVQDQWHEAGEFMRDNLIRYPNELPESAFLILAAIRKT
ncbi:MAG: hypothetical protein HC896_10380 [Bacteroidales bacterium]|nr:hypothetical protein [Bacteroidales bacterium]